MTQVKHVCWSSTDTNLHFEGKSPSILKTFKDNPVNTALEKMPKENTLQPHSKIA